MIISYRYNFIFIRPRKTAGTSMEHGLGSICGPDDTITPIGPRQEFARTAMGIHPRNYSKDKDLEARYLAAIQAGGKSGIKSLRGPIKKTGGLWGHAPISVVRNWVSDDFWNSAYKFATDRHPYEKAVSLAYFQYKASTSSFGLAEHLDRHIREHARRYSSFSMFSIDGKSVMDGFVLQHRLADDVALLRERLGLPPFEVPRARVKERSDKRPAEEILSDAQKEYIYQQCKEEFDLFGWKR